MYLPNFLDGFDRLVAFDGRQLASVHPKPSSFLTGIASWKRASDLGNIKWRSRLRWVGLMIWPAPSSFSGYPGEASDVMRDLLAVRAMEKVR